MGKWPQQRHNMGTQQVSRSMGQSVGSSPQEELLNFRI